MRQKIYSFTAQAVVLCISILLLTGCSLDIFKQKGEDVVSEEKHSLQEADSLPLETLMLNDQGEYVLEVKKALEIIGYEMDTSTDQFDLEMKKALKDFQSQIIELAASGVYDEDTRFWLKEALNHKIEISPGEGFHSEQISTDTKKVITVHNPTDILVLANKNHALPDGFEPDDLVAPNVRFPFTEDLPKRYIRKEAAKALEKLFAAAEKEGHILFAQSGYRSYERQVEVFSGHTNRLGEKEARRVSAVPGQSEHQTGLAMDITASSVDFELTQKFGETKEGKWVKEHAHKFGFIIRYEKGKEDITGYDYEPWHLRYVGKDVAAVIKENDLTLEAYLGAYD